MSNGGSPSNIIASPPRKTPSPPVKGGNLTDKSGTSEKVKLETIGRRSDEEVERSDVGKPEAVENATAASQSGGGAAAMTTANGANSAAIVIQRSASMGEETEPLDIDGTVQDPAEYSPPRVYYRSFRDQGCQMSELDLPILDFRDFLLQASPLLPYGWGVSPIEDSCSKGLCLTHTVVDALSLDSVWDKIVVVLPIRRIVRDRGRLEELECHVLVKRRPPSLLDDDVSLNPRHVNWENCVKTFRHVGDFIAMLREGGRMLDEELGGNSSSLIDHQLGAESKAATAAAAVAESQASVKGGAGRNQLRNIGQPLPPGDASPAEVTPANAPRYVYVQYAATANNSATTIPTSPTTSSRVVDRPPSRSPSPRPPSALAPPPPAQAIYFIDPVTHQIWTTTATTPTAPPPTSVIKVVSNDSALPPTPPKDLKPQFPSSSSHHGATPLAFAKVAPPSEAADRPESPTSPASHQQTQRPTSTSPTRQHQRIVYSELDAISKLRSLDERRKNPAASAISSGHEGRDFGADEEDEEKRGGSSPSFTSGGGESGQPRSDHPSSSRRSAGAKGIRGREENSSVSPVRSPKKMGHFSSIEVADDSHHHRHLQPRIYPIGKFVESNSAAIQQPNHPQQHPLQHGLPLLAASAALASPVAVPAVSSRSSRGGSFNNNGENRGHPPQQHNHQNSSHRQYHHRDPLSPPPSHRRDSAVRSPSPSAQSPIRSPPRLQQHRGSSSSLSLSLSASASHPQNQIVPFSPQRGYSTVSTAVANDEPSSSRASLHYHHPLHHLPRDEISSGSDFDPSTVAPLYGQRLPLNLKADHDQQQQRLQHSLHRSSHNDEGSSTASSATAHRASLSLIKSEGVAYRERENTPQGLKYHQHQDLPSSTSSHRYASSRSPSPSSPPTPIKSNYPQQLQQPAVRTQVSFNPATLLQQSGAARAIGSATKDNGNGGVYLWQCPVCQKPFMRKSSLVRHEKTHTGERPYGCPHCEKRFIQKSDLNRHIGLHTGQKPFKCSQCDKSYTQSNSLLEHSVRAHQCSEPYPCPHCPQRFMQRHMLTLHLTKGHRLPAPPPINGRATYAPVSSPSAETSSAMAAALSVARKRDRSPSPTPRVETPPLGEEVVVGTFNEEEGRSPSPSGSKEAAPTHVPQFGGVIFQSHVIGPGGENSGGVEQPIKKSRMNFFEEGKRELEEDRVEDAEVMDLRVGTVDTKKMAISAKS